MSIVEQRPTGPSRRDGFERGFGIDLPKRTALDRLLVSILAVLTYPAWLAPRTLRLWLLAKRATTWRRFYLIVDDVFFTWSLRYSVYFLLVVPVLLILGWVQRRLAPTPRR